LFKELKKNVFFHKTHHLKSKQQFIHQFFSLFKNKWKKTQNFKLKIQEDLHVPSKIIKNKQKLIEQKHPIKKQACNKKSS